MGGLKPPKPPLCVRPCKTRVKLCTRCGLLISPSRLILPNSNRPGGGGPASVGRFKDLKARCVTCSRKGAARDDLVRIFLYTLYISYSEFVNFFCKNCFTFLHCTFFLHLCVFICSDSRQVKLCS